MVLAEERQIAAIVKAVKELPVNCNSFEVADTWVGIIMELEKIGENKYEEPIKEVVDDG